MSWLSDLAPIFGGSVTLAGAMCGACVAAEKAARPEALKDIGRILKDTSWERSVRPSAIIQRGFVWTFGERQFGARCAQRSGIASFVALIVLSSLFWHEGGRETGKATPFLAAVSGILTLIIPDYIALGKSRVLIHRYGAIHQVIGSLGVILMDLLASAAISLLSLCVFQLLIFHELPNYDILLLIYKGLRFMVGLGPQPDPMPMYVMFLISTLFTSVWTILILLSATVLKLLAPLHRFTAWLFDVDVHPLRAVGIVSGALVMIGSLIWTVLRTVL